MSWVLLDGECHAYFFLTQRLVSIWKWERVKAKKIVTYFVSFIKMKRKMVISDTYLESQDFGRSYLTNTQQ